MSIRTLPLALACAFTTVAFTHADTSGRVADWAGGAADIMTYGHDAPIGRVHEDGSVTFDLPVPPPTGQTMARTFDRCRSSKLDVVNGETDVAPISLYVRLGDREVAMVGASSPEVAAWSLSFGQTPLSRGAFVRWLHAAAATSVSGDCVETVESASGPMTILTEYRLALEPGWNLIRTAHLEYLEHDDGYRHETHSVHDAPRSFPQDFAWYLE